MFELYTCLCDFGQILLCTVERKQVLIVNNIGREKKVLVRIDSVAATLPNTNAIYFLLAFVSTRASLSPDLTKAHR